MSSFVGWLDTNMDRYIQRWAEWMSFYRKNNFRWPDGQKMPVPQIYFDAEMHGAKIDIVAWLAERYAAGDLPELPPPPGSPTNGALSAQSAENTQSVGQAALKGALVGAGIGFFISRLMR